MGRWGMGMSSCDEFGDVKDEYFTEFYYTTKPLEQIEKDILQRYKESYEDPDEDDGIWHEVYFALAECGWKCGYIGQDVLNRVEYIINNKLDLKFMEELEASPQDLKQREKVLDKFLEKIKSKNDKPIRRVKKKPYENLFGTGDVFVYKLEGYYYGGVFLQVVRNVPKDGLPYKISYDYCIAVAELESEKMPSVSDIINAEIRYAGWVFQNGIPKKGSLEVIGEVEVSPDYRNYLCGHIGLYGMCFYGWFGFDLPTIISCEKNHYKKYLKLYKMNGKPVKYLFDTDKMAKTEDVHDPKHIALSMWDSKVCSFEDFWEEWKKTHNIKEKKTQND